MNIFYLNTDPIISAQQHCDKHVVKMIIEYAQLLSTAHRILDGEEYYEIQNGRRIKRWRLDDEWLEDILYKASHVNHPSAVWARSSNNNYTWLYCMWWALCKEYTYRYGKIHSTERLKPALLQLPRNISVGYKTQPPPAMQSHPECIVKGDSVESYHKYYRVAKKSFARWTKREVPKWYAIEQEA